MNPEKHVDLTNSHLPPRSTDSISLENGARNFVVSGPPQSPYGLEQNRVPYSQRKLKFSNRFLPITAPFHSPYVHEAYHYRRSQICQRVLTDENGSVVERLVKMVTSLPVNWEQATAFNRATHILDFGRGSVSGLGVLTHRRGNWCSYDNTSTGYMKRSPSRRKPKAKMKNKHNG
ncbi:hypothetical protein V1505DRAFT_356083 [Lipomyces doorenjongii]